jgi:hypothetical protein
MKHYQAEPGYADAHAAFITAHPAAAKISVGSCYEFSTGIMWVAYNPHAERTMTSRGQALQPQQMIVEIGATQVAVLGPKGGTTIDGCRGGGAVDLKTTFETGALTGYA